MMSKYHLMCFNRNGDFLGYPNTEPKNSAAFFHHGCTHRNMAISAGPKIFACRPWDGHVESRCLLISETVVLLLCLPFSVQPLKCLFFLLVDLKFYELCYFGCVLSLQILFGVQFEVKLCIYFHGSVNKTVLTLSP